MANCNYMVKKLALNRDFTRFQNDETFPYKVTVCIGEDRILCSGAILAQQSSVLEKKFREDNGILILEEMLDIGKHDQIIECFNYLHGADLEFTYENIETTMKFASWYEIDGLFIQSLIWMEDLLYEYKQTEQFMHFLNIADCLSPSDYNKVISVVNRFIQVNIDHVSENIINYLHLGISGFNLTTILDQSPSNANMILKKWVILGSENKSFILKNPKLFNYKKIFPNGDEFASFIATLSGGPESVEIMKILMRIQQDYFLENNNVDVTGASINVELGATSPDSSSGVGIKVEVKQPQLPSSNPWAQSSASPHMIDQHVSQENHCNKEVLDVYIHNVPHSVSKQKLTQLLKFAGQIDHIAIYRDHNGALVSFQDSRSANELLKSGRIFVIDGHTLSIQSHNLMPYGSTEVHIDNLPVTATNDKLVRLFKFAGHIINVDIDKNGSNATITFQDIQSATNLLDCGRRFLLDSNELIIDRIFNYWGDAENEYETPTCNLESQSDDESEEYDSEQYGSEEYNSDEYHSTEEYDSTEVYIGNIPPTATKRKLIKLFKFAGWITDVIIKDGSSAADIHFRNTQSATKLLDCERIFVLDGYKLRIERYLYDTAYIDNIPERATENDIKSLFSRFGKINDVSMIHNECGDIVCALVKFETDSSADAAIEHTNEITLLGNTLRVRRTVSG